MPLNIMTQEKWICKGQWTLELDALFTSIVLRQAKEFKYSIIITVSKWFLQAVYDELNAKAGGRNFSMQKIKERLQFYKARYHTFKVLVGNNNVQWVPNNRCITATDEV